MIKIGNIGSYTSPQSTAYVGTVELLRAWEQDVNAHGGIKGRKVELIIKDDQGNASTAVTQVKELIQREKVVAIVGQNSYVDSAWASIPQAAGIPVIGGGSYDPPAERNPAFFPSGTTPLPSAYGTMQVTKSFGKTMGVLYCAEAPICEQSLDLYRSFGKQVGVQLKLAQSVSASAPDYTSQCQALIDSKVEVVMINTAAQIALRIAKACYTQGLRAQLVQPGGTVTREWLNEPAAQGVRTIHFNPPYYYDSVAGMRTMLKLLEDNKQSVTPGGGAIFSYTGAQLFRKAAEAVDGTVTADALKNALYAMKDETLDGLAPPLTYTKDAGTSILCYFIGSIQNNAFTVPEPSTGCAPKDVIEEAKRTSGS
ncbi:ABC transporter substrate-binding protein [Amycolatopsis sp. GM8]|uniref:ABC transporter substrate-binding protein n=1 Tax=Amycolatopsis sp. GM8 TaxID=2896530 RepID=UPI001F4544B0|nr:ABC transporter substrate-binding protein [Amycolatopsis sp. GM8]